MSNLISLPTDIDWGTNQQTVDFINQQFDEIKKSEQNIVQRAILIGEALRAVQQKCKDDEFPKWIKNNFENTNLKKSSVYVYIAMTKNAEAVKDANSLREALKIINDLRDPEEPKPNQPDHNPEIIAFCKSIDKKTNDEKLVILQKMMDTCEELIFQIGFDDGTKNKLESLQRKIVTAWKAETDKERKKELSLMKSEIKELFNSL